MSPIFALTCDDNFGDYLQDKNIEFSCKRFSLLNLMIGDRIVYFGTYKIGHKEFKWFYLLELSKMPNFNLEEIKSNKLEEDYREHLKNLRNDELIIEKESLNKHIQDEASRIKTSNQKINTYTTIVLTVLPLILSILNVNQLFKLPTSLKICFFLGLYAVLNICIYLFAIIKVKSILKSSFKDLKNSQNKSKEINIQYYYDWQQLQRKADMSVSYVINVEKWVQIALVIGVVASLLWAVHNQRYFEQPDKQTKAVVYNIKIDEMDETYSESAVKWSKLIAKLQTGEQTKLLILCRECDDANAIMNKLTEFKKQKCEWIQDDSLDKKNIKIILEDNHVKKTYIK